MPPQYALRFESGERRGELVPLAGALGPGQAFTIGRKPGNALQVTDPSVSGRHAELELAAESGTPVEGTFSKAVKAGLEVDISGKRAFCPASQVDLQFVKDLETFVGQTHFFKVLEVRDNGRSIVVSRRALLEAERAEKAQELMGRLEVGAELEGIVQSLQPYGCVAQGV